MNVQIPLTFAANTNSLDAGRRGEQTDGGQIDLEAWLDVAALTTDGIHQVRGLVLDLAVRGMLVAQERGDAAASRPSESGESTGSSQDDDEVEPRFSLPASWAWGTLGRVCSYIQRGKSPTYADKSDVPVVSQKCVQWGGFLLDRARFVDPGSVAAYATERFLRPGDLLWNSTGHGTVGRVAVFVGSSKYPKVVADSHVTVLRTSLVEPRFLWCWLASPTVQRTIEDLVSGSTKQTELSTSTVVAHPVPLPPLAEQRRIVAKVDELMRMLDDLEAKQVKKLETKARLRTAALGALTSAVDPEALATAWARLGENFDVVFDRAESVEDLRLGVMDLASRGWLVPQDTRDQPATAATAVKRHEIARAIGEGRLVLAGADRGSLPSGWAWEMLGNLGEDPENPVQTGPFGAQLHRTEFVSAGVPVIAVGNLTGTGFTSDGLYFVSTEKAKMLARYDVRAGDLLFARSGATTGKVCVAPGFVNDWRMTGHILRVRLDRRLMLPELLVYWLWGSTAVRTQVMGNIRGGTRPGYNTGLLKGIAIPVPPLAEQRRIVAKIEQLMKLCDDLEVQLQRTETTASKLVEAVVAEMIA